MKNKFLDNLSGNYGVAAGLFRSFLISVTAIISKSLNNFRPNEILFYRSFFAFISLMFSLKIKKQSFSLRKILKLEFMIYGMMCCICSYLFILAVRLNPFSEAMILCHTSPFFSFFIEIFYKKEKFVLKELAYQMLIFIGVIFISSSDDFSLLTHFHISYSHAVCLLQAALTAFRVDFEKKIASKDQVNTLNFASLCSYLFYGVLASFYFGSMKIPEFNEFLMLFSAGVIVILSETLFLIGLKFEKVSVMLMIQSSRMFMSFLLEVLLLKTYPKISNIIVCVIITFSISRMKK